MYHQEFNGKVINDSEEDENVMMMIKSVTMKMNKKMKPEMKERKLVAVAVTLLLTMMMGKTLQELLQQVNNAHLQNPLEEELQELLQQINDVHIQSLLEEELYAIKYHLIVMQFIGQHMWGMVYFPANINLQINMISDTRKKNFNVLSMIGNK